MRNQSLKHQLGAATILMSILVGFSITAMGLAVMFNVQNAQDKQLTAQAQVNAQSIAWAGSEAFRQVLAALPNDELNKLDKNSKFIAAENAANKINPVIVDVKPVAANGAVKAHKEITVDLVATDSAAQVGTALRVVYSVFDAAAPPKPEPLTRSTYNYNLDAEGTLSHEGGEGEALAVNGNFNITSSVKGLSSVFATGNVKIEVNNILLKDVFANGTVTVRSNGNIADSLVGLEGVNIEQGFAGKVFSNKYVLYKTSNPKSSQSAAVRAISPVVNSVESAGYVELSNDGNVTVSTTRSNEYTNIKNGCADNADCFTKLEARGELTMPPNNVVEAFSLVKISCSGGGQPTSKAQAPILSNCDLNTTPNKFSKTTPVIAEVPKRSKRDLEPLPIDVWDQEEHANYVVRFDTTFNTSLIKVKSVASANTKMSLPDGEYGLIMKGTVGYLCPKSSISLSASKVAECSVATVNVVCSDGCWKVTSVDRILTADASGVKDSASPKTNSYEIGGYVAPGVFLFDGNISLKSEGKTRLSAAALLAAGYIKTDMQDSQALALNFAGETGGVVKDAAGKAISTVPGACSSLAGGAVNLIPANFCLPKFNPNAANNLGNVALMAGGQTRTVETKEALYKTTDTESTKTEEKAGQLGRITQTITKVIPDPANNKTFTEVTVKQPYYGGDIRLSAQNVVFGSILAGNLFRAEGQTKIYGYVVSSASALLRASGAGGGTVYNAGGLQLTVNGLTAETTLDHSVTHGEYQGGVLPGTRNPTIDPIPITGDRVQLLRARYF